MEATTAVVLAIFHDDCARAIVVATPRDPCVGMNAEGLLELRDDLVRFLIARARLASSAVIGSGGWGRGGGNDEADKCGRSSESCGAVAVIKKGKRREQSAA